MAKKPASGEGSLQEEVRSLLSDEMQHGGWSAARIAAEMQIRGFSGWNENVVNGFARGIRQSLGLDEGLALLGVLGGRAKVVLQRIESLTNKVVGIVERRGASNREDLS